MNRFCRGWSVAVGAMDALTGLLLVACPATTLGLLGITPPAGDALLFLRWVGVFVGSVGLGYALALRGPREGAAVWAFTALARALVAVFVTVNIVVGALDPHWFGVAATDAVVAAVQVFGLWRRWWR